MYTAKGARLPALQVSGVYGQKVGWGGVLCT